MKERIHVLIVDDEAPFVRNLERLLSHRGFQVTGVVDGPAALGVLMSGIPVDVVVLDVKMPGMDGIAVLREIRRIAPEIRVLMLTGHATLASGTQAIREGADDYLLKPCNIEDLTARIRAVFEAGRIRRHPLLWSREEVGDILTPPGGVMPPTALLKEAVALLVGDQRADGVMVVDPEAGFLGEITRRVIVEAAQGVQPHRAVAWEDLVWDPSLVPEIPVARLLSHPPETLPWNAGLIDAAHRLISLGRRSIPVTKGGELLGVLRLQDIFRHVEAEIE